MSDLKELREVEIDETNLDEELAKQSANFLFVSEKACAAESLYLTAKREQEELAARLDGLIRAELEDEGKKITERVVESCLVTHPDYIEQKKTVEKMRTQRDMMKALREAWYMRKDCLINIAYNKRAEISGLAAAVQDDEAA
jgi:hypothetical protein